ncbi:MAG TPA: MoxR family ATPase [Thermomicrobiales bacterium]|nr:MoxR family ATPase [Thermomicrobiales bacterium]
MTDGIGAREISEVARRVIAEVEKVIVGKRDVIERLTIAILCEGHVLLEDVPGLGKTMLARSLAGALGGEFSRVQFTPDLLPTDITGSLVFNPKTAEFSYREGPIVTNVLLADEINRAGPRTQSALLEAMEERQVSVERHIVTMPRPFFVIATQNPVELEGTFPLPEAQLDRFLMRLSIGYPEIEDERAMLRRFRENTPLESIEVVTTTDEMNRLIRAVRRIHISDAVEDYLLQVIRATRETDALEVGAGPRAALALARAAQAYAAVQGRDFVKPDDVRLMTGSVLAHRVIPTAQADLLGQSAGDLLAATVADIPVPVESGNVV